MAEERYDQNLSSLVQYLAIVRRSRMRVTECSAPSASSGHDDESVDQNQYSGLK